MTTLEQEYRAAYERGLAGLDYRGSWHGPAHQAACREGYAEGVSHRADHVATEWGKSVEFAPIA